MKLTTTVAAGVITALGFASVASAVDVYVKNQVLFELRAKNGGNQGAALEAFTINRNDLNGDLIPDDTNVLLDTEIRLGNLNGGPNVYGAGWTTGPEPAGTRGHINGGVAGSSQMDNIIAAYEFQVYDADGTFQFTEDIDDRVHISIDGVVMHTDTGWNTRTSPVFNTTPGWHDIGVYLVEDGGGAGQVGAPGFAFDHTATNTFFQINGLSWQGDIDPISGVGLRARLNGVPEPSVILLGAMGLAAGLGIRRRRQA